jgi:hypothetical protein
MSQSARRGPRASAVLVDAKRGRPRCATMPAAKLPLSTYEFPESEIAGHWMKIAIVVEQ